MVDAQTNILLVWVIVFLIAAASIPLGLSAGLATVLLANSTGLADLSLYPKASPAAKAVASVWIVVFVFYFATQAARAARKNGDTAAVLKDFFVKPFMFVIAFFALMLVFGLLIRL